MTDVKQRSKKTKNKQQQQVNNGRVPLTDCPQQMMCRTRSKKDICRSQWESSSAKGRKKKQKVKDVTQKHKNKNCVRNESL